MKSFKFIIIPIAIVLIFLAIDSIKSLTHKDCADALSCYQARAPFIKVVASSSSTPLAATQKSPFSVSDPLLKNRGRVLVFLKSFAVYYPNGSSCTNDTDDFDDHYINQFSITQAVDNDRSFSSDTATWTQDITFQDDDRNDPFCWKTEYVVMAY